VLRSSFLALKSLGSVSNNPLEPGAQGRYFDPTRQGLPDQGYRKWPILLSQGQGYESFFFFLPLPLSRSLSQDQDRKESLPVTPKFERRRTRGTDLARCGRLFHTMRIGGIISPSGTQTPVCVPTSHCITLFLGRSISSYVHWVHTRVFCEPLH